MVMASNMDYVPASKAIRADESGSDLQGWLWEQEVDPETDKAMLKANRELSKRYPDEYQDFYNKLLLEIKDNMRERYEKEMKEYEKKLGEFYGTKLEKEKHELARVCEQEADDEIKKGTIKEEKITERRKEMECKRAYSKIKNEMMNVKMEDDKICLQCGTCDVAFGCKCDQAFYCNKTCLKNHEWIHGPYCRAKKI
eukprot:Seg1693.15 transcript_id=Seg1693.15/GoldUCD/mRNA.D3Y31 product="hypothetical protein" protein_id=Seg1693.15/GoldUCD/D3Y31